MTRVLLRIMMAVALLGAATPRTPAEDCCPGSDSDVCQVCGRHCNCGKTCRLVPGTRKVAKTCYSSKCEDMCIPNPSDYCGKTCEKEIDPCTGCVTCVRKQHWTPTPCGRVITLHVLVKKEVVKEVPAYRWEVVHVCDNCRNRCAAESRAVPKDMIANQPPQIEEDATQVVQASAVSSPASGADQARGAGSASVAVKQKLMSLLGK